jgi:hypothetical protein
MMRRIVWSVATLIAVGVFARPAVAQQPGQGMGQRPGARAELLRGRIEEQFMRRIQEEMGLSDETTARMQRVVTASAGRRRTLEQQEIQLRQALSAQLRPGVAANSDSVGTYVDELIGNRIAYAQSFRDEMKELTPILTPVQRGQFQQLRDRFMLRMQEVQQQRKMTP